MKKSCCLALCLAFFTTSFLSAQSPNDTVFLRRLSQEILRHGKAYDWLRELTKGIGGRLAGSANFTRAVAWGEEKMKEAGAEKVWLQACLMPHWDRGGKDQASIVRVDGKKTTIELDVLALGNSLGTEKPVQAEVLAVADYAELEAKKDQVKGKIIYYNYGFDPGQLDPRKSYGLSGAYRRSGASRAAKYGAVGIMIRTLTESVANNPHTGGMSYVDSLPKIPAIAIGPRDADQVWEMSRNSSLVVKMHTHGKFLPDAPGHNVIGEWVGTEHPDQFITIGGHLDSWDVNEGAHDDGAGVVHTLEILRALKALGYKPKHSIRFVLFANEENGLRGGNKYAEEAKAKNEKHIFALESDEGGFAPQGFGFTAKPDQMAKIQTWLPYLSPFGTDVLEKTGGGADIGPLNRLLGTTLAGFVPDPHKYFDHHHARSDVFENVNKRELLLGAVNMAALIYLVDQYGL